MSLSARSALKKQNRSILTMTAKELQERHLGWVRSKNVGTAQKTEFHPRGENGRTGWGKSTYRRKGSSKREYLCTFGGKTEQTTFEGELKKEE